jgi:hypothetical protein
MVTDLYTASQEVLDAAVQALDTIPVSAPGLGGAPERVFVSAGAPVLDCCDQLTVHVQDIREAATPPLELGPGTRHKQDFWINLIRFQITIGRCFDFGSYPSGGAPDPALLDEAAQQTQADAWALWNVIHNLMRERPPSLFSICELVFNDGITALTPAGGCYGWVMSIRGEVDGNEGT